MYKFRVRCALFKDLTCKGPSLLHTVTVLLDINGGTFNFIRTPHFGVFLQHAYNMFLISRSRLKLPRMLRMFPRFAGLLEITSRSRILKGLLLPVQVARRCYSI